MTRVGLRIDVDTLRGTRTGVPELVRLLSRYHVRASFFFSAGPDNMGRHVWRLLRPAFLAKMVRTKAGRLYGWDILLRGTMFPGPVIGKSCPAVIRDTAADGHEVGLHAWDHHAWQTGISRMDRHAVEEHVQKGVDLLGDILGRVPDGFAAPSWRITPEALDVLAAFPFRFQSDCRGQSLFLPVVDGRVINRVQVPATLPTYDEVIGFQCKRPDMYNTYLIEQIRPDRLNVLTIHAEVEGIACRDLFRDFLEQARQRDIVLEPLGSRVDSAEDVVPSRILKKTVAGREGWLSVQEDFSAG